MALALAATSEIVPRAAADAGGFRIGRPGREPWQEDVLTAVAEQRFQAIWLSTHTAEPPDVVASVTRVVAGHLDAAEAAAEGRNRGLVRRMLNLSGADVERALGHLDSATTTLLRLAPEQQLRGRLPSLLATVRAHMLADDPRRQHVELLATRLAEGGEIDAPAREGLISSYSEARTAGRRDMARVRSFRNILALWGVLLAVAAAAVVLLGVLRPDVLPLCFTPNEAVVCPTSRINLDPGPAGAAAVSPAELDRAVAATARPWDVVVVAFVGLLASALASAAAVRNIQGTSTPYFLPVISALFKLPTGILTAFLGIQLMRGEFVPGLSALDTPEQIVAWAIVFGYSQQLLTRFVDQRAQTVLGNVRSSGSKPATTPAPRPA